MTDDRANRKMDLIVWMFTSKMCNFDQCMSVFAPPIVKCVEHNVQQRHVPSVENEFLSNLLCEIENLQPESKSKLDYDDFI